MFFIPGQLIAAITFPGVIVHEVAHQLFCRIFRVPVYEVKYFQFDNPAGYVLHERVDRPFINLFICLGPIIINTLLGALIVLSPSIQKYEFGSAASLAFYFQAWLGVSILMHAFPSMGDAKSLVQTVLKNKEVSLLAKILTAPVVGMIYLGAFGSFLWLDLGYAVAVSLIVPKIVVGLL